MKSHLRPRVSEDTGPPKEWFLEPEWFARDLAAVFRPRWMLAGHLSEISETGQYLTYSLGSDEVLICRDKDGGVSAYHNVCSHRGARLCSTSKGKLGDRIVCPYHGWSYSRATGALLAAPYMHEDFDPSPWGLRKVHVDIWFDLIFVCVADEAPIRMADYIGSVALGGYNFGDVQLACVKSHEINANWKIVIENNLECYHCPQNHPELIAIRDWKSTAFTRKMTSFDSAIKARAEGVEVFRAEVPCVHTIKGEKVCTIPLPRYDTEDEPSAYAVLWEPGVVMILSRDHGWIFSPKPIDVSRTELKQYWFVAKNALAGKDYDPERLQKFWDTTMQQDRVICENVQKGMEMGGYVPGPLNRIHQVGQAGFYAWYTRQIETMFPQAAHSNGPTETRPQRGSGTMARRRLRRMATDNPKD